MRAIGGGQRRADALARRTVSLFSARYFTKNATGRLESSSAEGPFGES